MEVRCNLFALKGFENDGDVTISGSFYARGKVSCKTLKVDGDFYLDGGDLFCEELYVSGDVFVRGHVYMKSESSVVPTSCKVDVGGDFICDGTFAAHGGEVTINGCFITTSIVRLGYARLKVSGDVDAQYLDCGEIAVGGDINIQGMLDAKGRIYVLGNINSCDITPNLNNIYCGGLCTANRYSVGKVFENVKSWDSLN